MTVITATPINPSGGGGSGDVVGPAGATDNAIARYDGATGKLIQDSLVFLSDTGDISLPAFATVDGRDISIDGAILDAHVTDPTIHFTEASIDHTAILNIGTNSHAAIDTHIADATIHFTEASIDHTAILNIGTNSHAAIDTHIADATIHFTQASIDHTAILNIGTNSHAAIDTHIADATIHFSVFDGLSDVSFTGLATDDFLQYDGAFWVNVTPTSVAGDLDHQNLSGAGTNNHTAIDSHIADATIHFTEASIDHTAILNIGSNSHAAIDTHIADGDIHVDHTAVTLTAGE